jgi:hypothetical protein
VTQEQVVSLMESSRNAKEWDDNADKVKAACGGYPDFWFQAIVTSGLARRVAASFGGSAEIKVTGYGRR